MEPLDLQLREPVPHATSVYFSDRQLAFIKKLQKQAGGRVSIAEVIRALVDRAMNQAAAAKPDASA